MAVLVIRLSSFVSFQESGSVNRKGFSNSINIVITIVVLMVVALVLITTTTKNVSNAGEKSSQQDSASICSLWKSTACVGGLSGIVTHPSINGCSCDCDGKSIGCLGVSGTSVVGELPFAEEGLGLPI